MWRIKMRREPGRWDSHHYRKALILNVEVKCFGDKNEIESSRHLVCNLPRP